jgi:hypothetical protein
MRNSLYSYEKKNINIIYRFIIIIIKIYAYLNALYRDIEANKIFILLHREHLIY